MPSVQKQAPVVKRPVVQSGSVLDEANPIDEVNDEWLQIVIYGGNRVGKTTLACQFPKPLLLVSMEPNRTGGAMSVRKVAGVDYLRLKEKGKIVRLAQELVTDTKYKTVVLDSVTSLQDIVLMSIMNLSEMPEQLNWGSVTRDQYRDRSEQTRECLRPFLNLSKHVVLLGKEKDHNPPDKEKPEMLRGFTQESFIGTELGGATVGWLHDACDYICRLSIDKEVKEKTIKVGTGTVTRAEETGKLIRRLRTSYHPNYAAGFRSANPDAVPEFIEEPTFDKIWKVIKGEKLPSSSTK